MLKLAEFKRLLLDWQPSGAGLVWLLAMGWWLVLGWPLRRSLRPALGSATGEHPVGPPTRPRRPKDRPRPSYPRVPYPSAA
jgi:hypothetical protein